MYIHEAIQRALAYDGNIARVGELWGVCKPYDTNDVMSLMVFDDSQPPCYGWQPKVNDLIANDWYVVNQ